MRPAGARIVAFGMVATALIALAGCQTAPPRAAACPVGQISQQTAQLYFAGMFGPASKISDIQFRKYVDEELTPRFPDGLTVLDGGRQWRGEENKAIREAAKVVLIVLPKAHGAQSRINAARSAYWSRFHQDAVVEVMPPACVAL
jgi:hypothetical protein